MESCNGTFFIHLLLSSLKNNGNILIGYFSYGSQQPGRFYQSQNSTRGFGNQEKDNEIYGAGNAYTAEYWEYDPRLGRRWNTDPVVMPNESPYAAFLDNPIVFNDPTGASAASTTRKIVEFLKHPFNKAKRAKYFSSNSSSKGGGDDTRGSGGDTNPNGGGGYSGGQHVDNDHHLGAFLRKVGTALAKAAGFIDKAAAIAGKDLDQSLRDQSLIASTDKYFGLIDEEKEDKTDTPWMDWAYSEYNIKGGVKERYGNDKEGKPLDNPRILEYLKSAGIGGKLLHDETAWCASFAHWCMGQAGITGGGALGANWKTWGKPLDKPTYGAIAVFKTGHIGLVVGTKGNKLIILHGNWSDKISLSDYIDPSEIQSYRYPTGYKPAAP